jgi:aldose 1-epimerase
MPEKVSISSNGGDNREQWSLAPHRGLSQHAAMKKKSVRSGFLALAFFLLSTGCPALAQDAVNLSAGLTVTKEPFGSTRDGEAIELYTLKNADGLTAKVMTYGAIIYSLAVPDRNGRFTNVTVNRETITDYEKKSACFGALLGRYANRIGGAQFTLDGRQYSLPRNNGPHHIHGGRGFDKRVWKGALVPGKDSAAVKLTYLSKDGEEGYPGTLTCTVLYELNNRNEWKMDYTATTDKPTVINLSNHAYWNLAGAQSGTMLDQLLTVNADQYLRVDDALIPTGEKLPVQGTPLDFRTPHRIGERIGQVTGRQFNGGYDHCFVLKHEQPGDLGFCAKLNDPPSGRTMEVLTTEPGVQLYSANFPSGAFEGPNGYSYPRHAGICLETQHFPDSPNKPGFPTTILRPGETYHTTTVHRFSVEK